MSNTPTHRAGIFVKGVGDKDYFLKLAPGWKHKTGKGIKVAIPPGVSISGDLHVFETDDKDEPAAPPQA